MKMERLYVTDRLMLSQLGKLVRNIGQFLPVTVPSCSISSIPRWQ